MRIKSLFTLLALVCLAAGLVLSLSGCGGGTSQPSSVPDPVVADTADPIVQEPVPIVVAPDVEETTPTIEEPAEDPVEQPILSWARDEGGLNHCDRLSIYEDGRVEAVVCRATTIEPTIHSTLSDEQIAQVRGWLAAYAPFTRREMEMTRAVRTTMLQGSGEAVPELEVKKEVTAFAAELFFALTGTE